MLKYLGIAFLGGYMGVAHSAVNVDASRIESIEVRSSGAHAVYLVGSMPSSSCTYNDRAIILDNGSVGGKALLDTALAAFIANKTVIIRVDGCAFLNPEASSVTSPRIIKIQVFNL